MILRNRNTFSLTSTCFSLLSLVGDDALGTLRRVTSDQFAQHALFYYFFFNLSGLMSSMPALSLSSSANPLPLPVRLFLLTFLLPAFYSGFVNMSSSSKESAMTRSISFSTPMSYTTDISTYSQFMLLHHWSISSLLTLRLSSKSCLLPTIMMFFFGNSQKWLY